MDYTSIKTEKSDNSKLPVILKQLLKMTIRERKTNCNALATCKIIYMLPMRPLRCNAASLLIEEKWQPPVNDYRSNWG